MQHRSSLSGRHLRAVRRSVGPPGPPRRFLRVLLSALLGIALLGGLGATALLFVRETVPSVVEVSLVPGSVEIAVEADAVLVRHEQTVAAPVAGTVQRLVQEGVRVRTGTPVVAVAPPGGGGATEVKATVSGVVLFQTDGLESRLDPARVKEWSPSWYQGLGAPEPRRTAEGSVQAGEVLVKIVDAFGQGLVLSVAESQLPALEEGAEAKLRFGAGREDPPVSARIERLWREGGAVLLYLIPRSLPENLGEVRRTRLSLILAEFTGKVAPRSAIDVREGRQGVWVLEGTSRHFVPVKVIGGNESRVIVESELPPGARILKVAPSQMD